VVVAPALAALLALPGVARAQQGSDTGAPIQGQSPGDVTVPPTGSPAAPKAPGTPLTEPEALESPSNGGAPGTGRLLEALGGATGSDPVGSVAPGEWISLDKALDVFLGAAIGGNSHPGWNVYPLPVITNSRNEGTTLGAIMPLVYTNARGEVTQVFAPTLTYNQIFGTQFGVHGLYYDGSMAVGGGALVSDRIAKDFYGEVLDEAWLDGRAAIEAFGRYQIDPSERWWGFGADTPNGNETNYTLHQAAARLNLGLNLSPRMQILWRERVNDVTIAGGRVPNVPDTRTTFGEIPGSSHATVFGSGIEFRWDLRDQAFRPRRGLWLGVVLEGNLGLRGNTQLFFPRAIVDLRGFITPGPDWLTFAARLRFETVPGGNVPFYEQAILGGPLTLRAYGTGRWTGSSSFLFQLEARATFLSKRIFGTWIEMSVVPFVDVGRVFEGLGDVSSRHWRVNPGVGIRMAVPPTIVVRGDVAWGDSGPVVFLGLGLPF
jgi:hypothetical protein